MCFKLRDAWWSFPSEKTGKRKAVYRKSLGDPKFWSESFKIPCSSCLACRLDDARQKAVRCVHEASLYEQNSFLTLTYRDEDLPVNNSVDIKDVQDFMKRLREEFSHKTIRSFGCAEYGDKKKRPHYHIILFNHQFEDLDFWKNSPTGFPMWNSPTFSKLWDKGWAVTSDFSWQVAGYVSRYVTKKIRTSDNVEKERSERYHEYCDLQTGERKFVLTPERGIALSTMPGIGFPWLEKNWKSVYPADRVVIDGREMRPPRYYDRKLEQFDKALFDTIKLRRKENFEDTRMTEDRFRQIAREQFKFLQFKRLLRSLE